MLLQLTFELFNSKGILYVFAGPSFSNAGPTSYSVSMTVKLLYVAINIQSSSSHLLINSAFTNKFREYYNLTAVTGQIVVKMV